jgi:hypothetical protein
MDKTKELKEGDKVKVMRQIGKKGVPTEVTGTIERFNSVIRINGEKTATIKYDDGMPSYSHQLSKISKINS